MTGYAIQIFGGSYLLAVFLPENDTPDYCEFRRIHKTKETHLSEDGWIPATEGPAKKIIRDPNRSPKYFCYYIDENVGKDARYMFRFRRSGVYSPWRELDHLNKVILPAPKMIKAVRSHGNIR